MKLFAKNRTLWLAGSSVLLAAACFLNAGCDGSCPSCAISYHARDAQTQAPDDSNATSSPDYETKPISDGSPLRPASH